MIDMTAAERRNNGGIDVMFLIKGRLKRAFAPLPLGGAGGGAQLRQREKQITCVAGFQPARDFSLRIDS
jgi:hypothetical protein